MNTLSGLWHSYVIINDSALVISVIGENYVQANWYQLVCFYSFLGIYVIYIVLLLDS